MVGGLFHIKLNDTDEKKDDGFYSLITSGASIICLDDEEYLVEEQAIKKLEQENIDFDKVEEEDRNSEGRRELQENDEET